MLPCRLTVSSAGKSSAGARAPPYGDGVSAVGDCTGRNANVFYELGFAHALDKQAVLITQDDVESLPIDVRHYEFVKYSLGNDRDFVANLDNALRNVFAGRYDEQYRQALNLFDAFRASVGFRIEKTSKESFAARLASLERSGSIPSDESGVAIARLLLPNILADPTDPKLVKQAAKWLSTAAKAMPKP